jgi:hypothetical protein
LKKFGKVNTYNNHPNDEEGNDEYNRAIKNMYLMIEKEFSIWRKSKIDSFFKN